VTVDPRLTFDAASLPGMRERLASEYARFRAAEARQIEVTAPPEAGGVAGAYRSRDCPCCGMSSDDLVPVLRAHGLDLVNCPGCRLTYAKRVMNDDAEAARYARSDLDEAALRLHGSAPYLELESARARYYLARTGGRPGHLLEIGCGTGTLLLAAAAAGWTAMGIEPGVAAAGAARARGARVVTGWFPGDLPAAPTEFDAICLLDVLEHFADPLRFLRQVRARLAEGGRLLIQVPNWDSLLVRLEGASSSTVCPGHWSYFTPATLAALLARARFRAIGVETVVSERDRIAAFPPARIEGCVVGNGSWPLSACELMDRGMGYKILAVFIAEGIGRR
jgi:SAM-dependent methyltransferase